MRLTCRIANSRLRQTTNQATHTKIENELDYLTTRDGLNDVNDAAQRRTEKLNVDVNKRNEASEYVRNENSNWPDSAVYPKKQEKFLPDLSKVQKNDANLTEKNSKESDTKDFPSRE